MAEKSTWLVTHDSHELKKGDTFTGETLPLWLVGKVKRVEQPVFEVATPTIEPPAKPKAKTKKAV
ncbi:hypothetical protein KCT17_003652 [Escherichia coli]|nr:hypothetical protein [Escherichia coli]